EYAGADRRGSDRGRRVRTFLGAIHPAGTILIAAFGVVVATTIVTRHRYSPVSINCDIPNAWDGSALPASDGKWPQSDKVRAARASFRRWTHDTRPALRH